MIEIRLTDPDPEAVADVKRAAQRLWDLLAEEQRAEQAELDAEDGPVNP
jgi:hypothetical protein